MKIYKTNSAIIIEKENKFYSLNENNWDAFINDDYLYQKVENLANTLPEINFQHTKESILAPIGSQEIWACGVTYLRSKIGRQEESQTAGGSDFYARVYEAERPEVFFKANPFRVVGHRGMLHIRKDSTWDVPEPELTLVVSSTGKILGYTIGNDMSSRSIEGENPLYLPQAKTYDGCAAIGPCIFVSDKPIDPATVIRMDIRRNGQTVFKGSVSISQMKRSCEELVGYVYRECSFPNGALIMTGTGIVPDNDFTLQQYDEINIHIDHIGLLVNQIL